MDGDSRRGPVDPRGAARPCRRDPGTQTAQAPESDGDEPYRRPDRGLKAEPGFLQAAQEAKSPHRRTKPRIRTPQELRREPELPPMSILGESGESGTARFYGTTVARGAVAASAQSPVRRSRRAA